MSEAAVLNPETTLEPTALSAVLRAGRPKFDLRMYGGVLTVPAFCDPEQELSAATQGVAVADLGHRTRIRLRGEDRVRWANGMVSNAIQSLPTGHGNYSFVLNAQGRIQGDGYIYHLPDSLLLDTDRAQASRLFTHLDHFIIMDDVVLDRLDDATTGLALIGPRAAELLDQLALHASALSMLQCTDEVLAGVPVLLVHAYSVLVPRYEMWFSPGLIEQIWKAICDAGAQPIGSEAQETLRVLEGTPAYGVDITDRHLPQETSQVRALNFQKGCYLGQEIVERIRSRATVHRSIRHFALEGDAPAVPVELHLGDASGLAATAPAAVGQLTSVARVQLPGFVHTVAIGSIRNEVLDRKSRIEYDGGTAKLLTAAPALP